MKSTLTFFITLNKQTGGLVLSENTFLSLKIPKKLQKPDSNVKSSVLWVCHLPKNSSGIVFISFYPNELVIKKKLENKNEEMEEYENLANYEKNKEEEGGRSFSRFRS